MFSSEVAAPVVSEGIASHADCHCALMVFGLGCHGCNLAGTGLALVIHSSSELGGIRLATYPTAFCLDLLAWLKLEASKRVTCARTATRATVTRAGPLFVVLPARRPRPWWQAHTR